MATTVTFQSTPDTTMSTQRVRGTITLSGSYTSGGDTLNLGGSLSPIRSNQQPLYIDFAEITTTPSGAGFAYVPGSNLTNGKLYINTTYNTQLSAGAYPSILTGTTLYFEAVYPLGM